MKTITEYQPLIYSHLGTDKRSGLRRQLRTDLLMAFGYCAGGLWLAYDTGFLVWEWQFWTMFAPFVLAGELASRVMTKSSES